MEELGKRPTYLDLLHASYGLPHSPTQLRINLEAAYPDTSVFRNIQLHTPPSNKISPKPVSYDREPPVMPTLLPPSLPSPTSTPPTPLPTPQLKTTTIEAFDNTLPHLESPLLGGYYSDTKDRKRVKRSRVGRKRRRSDDYSPPSSDSDGEDPKNPDAMVWTAKWRRGDHDKRLVSDDNYEEPEELKDVEYEIGSDEEQYFDSVYTNEKEASNNDDDNTSPVDM
jgi:hypothetical protein